MLFIWYMNGNFFVSISFVSPEVKAAFLFFSFGFSWSKFPQVQLEGPPQENHTGWLAKNGERQDVSHEQLVS